MSWLRRWIGGGDAGGGRATGETETVRRIAARLERLPPERARFLAAFAYVLARVAHADLHITEVETDAMQRSLEQVAGLPAEQAALAVEIAKTQARLLGGTENYVVTREFREQSGREDRVRLLEALYAVAGADGTISAEESREIAQIAEELGFTRQEANAFRLAHRDKLSELQGLPGADRRSSD